MAQIFALRIINGLDDSNYYKMVIVPDGYTVDDIKTAYAPSIKLDKSCYEQIADINRITPNWFAYTEDDFKEIEDTLNDLKLIK